MRPAASWKRYLWPGIWAGACATLVAVVALQRHLFTADANGEAPVPARVADAKLLPPMPPPPAASPGDETTARPLFVPSRRPSPPALAEAAPVFKRGQFALVGTIVAGDESLAFLREASSGKVRRVAKGEKVSDLTLSDVAAASVTLVLGDDSETLALQVAKGPPAAAMPPRGGAAAAQPPAALPSGQPAAPAPAAAAEAPASPASTASEARRSRFFGQSGGAGFSGLLGRGRGAGGAVAPAAPAPTRPAQPDPAGPSAEAPAGEVTFAELARRRARELNISPK